MNRRVLFVDDEPNVLDGIRRQLRKKYDVVTATGGQEALAVLEEQDPFAVIVSDMRMPIMDGVEFLRRASEPAPDAVRMILSGQADMESTVAAVNHGNLFRFLTKPCNTEDLTAAVDAAIRQFDLIMAERQLLEETLSGAVQLLTDVLAMASPTAFSRVSGTQRVLDELVSNLDIPLRWEWRLAGMLAFVGCLSIPDDTLRKAFAGQELDDDEREAFDAHPEVARELLSRIPRLEEVAEIVGRQSGIDPGAVESSFAEWDDQVLGGQLLKTAARFNSLLVSGHTRGGAYGDIRDSKEVHPKILQALARVQVDAGEVAQVSVLDLRTGMILDENVMSPTGSLLLAEGYEVTDAIMARLKNHAARGDIVEPFRVRLGKPAAGENEEGVESVASADAVEAVG